MKLTETLKPFEPCPEYKGRAVCVDVTPLKKVQTAYGEKEKFRLVYEIDMAREDGSRWCVWSSGFSALLTQKSSFRGYLEKWFGRPLTPEELKEFDTESLIGKPAYLVVIHNKAENGQTYANIAICTKHDQAFPPSGKFVRQQDRPKDDATYRRAEARPAGEDDKLAVKVHVGQFAGIELRDLSHDAVRKLIEKWLPAVKTAAKPTADDRRLMAALEAYEQTQGVEVDDIPY